MKKLLIFAAALTVAASTALAQSPLIYEFTPGTPRNNVGLMRGMEIEVGQESLIITALGRIFLQGNTNSHNLIIASADNTNNFAVVPWQPLGESGQIHYATLPEPFFARAETRYYIASEEQSGGDTWYSFNTQVLSTGDASVLGPIYTHSSGTWTSPTNNAPNHSYGPVGALYTVYYDPDPDNGEVPPPGPDLGDFPGSYPRHLTFVWDPPPVEDNVRGYRLYVTTNLPPGMPLPIPDTADLIEMTLPTNSTNTFLPFMQIPGDALSVTLTNIWSSMGSWAFFVLTATNEIGESPFSNPAALVRPLGRRGGLEARIGLPQTNSATTQLMPPPLPLLNKTKNEE